MIHDAAGIVRSMIHDAAGIGRHADHDAAGIGRSMIHDGMGGPRHHPCDARHEPSWGLATDVASSGDDRDVGHHAAIHRPSIPTTVQRPTG